MICCLRQHFLWIAFMFSLVSVVAGANAPSRPTEAIDPKNCVTAECHGEVVEYPMIHGPVGARTCDVCHLPASIEEHTFELRRQRKELCTYCHEFDTGMLPTVHYPVQAGECLGCHNPHGGNSRAFVREATMAETCGRCHESATHSHENLHDPVAKDQCTACHRPHAARYPNLLDVTGSALCLSCHDDFACELGDSQFQHQALEEGCERCHDPHGSSFPKGVFQQMPDLCLDCHQDICDSIEGAFSHPATLGPRGCLTCHTPHGGNLSKLMCDLPVNVCLTCHDKEITAESGSLVASVNDIRNPDRFLHTPVAEGQCGGCHSIHGGATPLLHEYATSFYEPYSEEKYDLCFECHDKSLLEEDMSGLENPTGFRNGAHNLHYLHVAANIGKDRSCGSCHGTHSSTFPSLIRKHVQYGNWRMAADFRTTATGGTCATACHPEYSYDRENPVPEKTMMATAVLARTVPLADKREPITVAWTGRDVADAVIDIPATDKPTVLLFLRGEQREAAEAVELTLAARPQIDDAQVVAVFCGERAGDHAGAFAAQSPSGWRIAADEEQTFARHLGIMAWPAILVVNSDGTVLTHRSLSPTLTLQLEAYIDMATGKTTCEDMTDRFAVTGVVGDGAEQRARWYLQMGNNLMEKGDARRARAMFGDGLELSPDSTDLQVALIGALIELRDGPAAIQHLDRLPAEAIQNWQRDLLRARALALSGRWKEARTLAEAVIESHPEEAAAHYVLGQAYEQDSRWEEAAAEFRAAARP